MKKYIAAFLSLLLIITLTSMVLGWIRPMVFWITAALIGVIAYFIMPKIK